MKIGILVGAMDSHTKLHDAGTRVLNTNQIKRLTLIDSFEQGRFKAAFEGKLDRADAGSIGLAESNLSQDWQFLEVQTL